MKPNLCKLLTFVVHDNEPQAKTKKEGNSRLSSVFLPGFQFILFLALLSTAVCLILRQAYARLSCP